MKKLIFILALLITKASAQFTPPPVSAYEWSGSAWSPAVSSASSGALSFNPPPAALYCFNTGLSQWVPADSSCFGGGGGAGTVTSFSSGNLSPLFTTSVATATTTPALTFTLSSVAANTAFGNFTGSTAAPSFTATTGTGSPVAATSPTLITPALGTPASGVITNLTGTCTACTANSATTATTAANLSGGSTVTGTPAASVSAIQTNATLFTGGSGTTTFPYLLLQPSGATAETGWSANGTFIGINSASGFTGNFIDVHLNNAASVFSVTSSGTATSGVFQVTGGAIGVNSTAFLAGSAKGLLWSSTTAFNGTADVGLDRSAAGIVEVNNGTIGNSSGTLKASAVTTGAIQQTAASATGGTCAMSTGTSCTITIAKTYTTPVCIATQQSATLTGGAVGCTVSGTTVTITSAVANSETWGAFVFGNPN